MYSWTYAENDCQEMYTCEREREKEKRKKNEYKGGGQRKNKL